MTRCFKMMLKKRYKGCCAEFEWQLITLSHWLDKRVISQAVPNAAVHTAFGEGLFHRCSHVMTISGSINVNSWAWLTISHPKMQILWELRQFPSRGMSLVKDMVSRHNCLCVCVCLKQGNLKRGFKLSVKMLKRSCFTTPGKDCKHSIASNDKGKIKHSLKYGGTKTKVSRQQRLKMTSQVSFLRII